RSFYSTLFRLAWVIVLQNLITFSVNLADNVMIGRYSEAALNGVAIANQLQFLLQMFAGGIASGISVISAQYWGQRRTEPIKRITAVGMVIGLIGSGALTVAAVAAPQGLLRILTNSPEVVTEGAKYVRIIAASYCIFTVGQVLLGMLRSVETVKIGFWVSLASLGINVGLNYVLIFGHLGLEPMGIRGAAIATLAARLVEFGVIIGYLAFADKKLHVKLRELFALKKSYLLDYLRSGLPLSMSSISWGLAMTVQTAIIGRMGDSMISANTVATTVFQVVSVVISGTASATSVLIGNTVGAGRYEAAKEYAKTLQVIYLILGVVSSAVLFAVRDPVISLFNSISAESAELSRQFIHVLCVTIIGTAYQMSSLTGIVSGGGQTGFVFVNDLIFMWGIVLPSSLLAAFVFHASPVVVFACLKADQVLKCAVAVVKVNRFTWIRKLTR
ncbi:MAG: MATE family efflux transporter, partial [Ruminococcaceae bacterium]|nr:MATE family efflux transporter [Oscillospiraceae bacterium]